VAVEGDGALDVREDLLLPVLAEQVVQRLDRLLVGRELVGDEVDDVRTLPRGDRRLQRLIAVRPREDLVRDLDVLVVLLERGDRRVPELLVLGLVGDDRVEPDRDLLLAARGGGGASRPGGTACQGGDRGDPRRDRGELGAPLLKPCRVVALL
jgi:hypothetical protein